MTDLTKWVVTKTLKLMCGITVMIILLVGVGTIESTYSMSCVVINVNRDVVKVEDKAGYVWEFKGDGFSIGDEVKVVFDTNHTDSNRFDDKIKDVKKL